MFLEGKMFPYGSLSQEKWRNHVYDMAIFLTTDEFLKELINFDPE
jgi:glutamate racemase